MLLTLASLAAATTAPLTPSGKWTVDYRKDMCVVSRPFATGQDTAMFAIQPSPVMTSSAAKLFLFLPKTGDATVHRGAAMVTLQPSGVVTKAQYVSWIPAGTAVRSYYLSVDATFGDAMKAATSITMSMGDTYVSLNTGEFAPVLAAMRTCNLDLFKSWGFVDTGKVEPAESPAKWFTDKDWPPQADRTRLRVSMVLSVAPGGKATACHVVNSSGFPALDTKTCNLAIARGRYKPFEGTAPRAMVLSVEWNSDGF